MDNFEEFNQTIDNIINNNLTTSVINIFIKNQINDDNLKTENLRKIIKDLDNVYLKLLSVKKKKDLKLQEERFYKDFKKFKYDKDVVFKGDFDEEAFYKNEKIPINISFNVLKKIILFNIFNKLLSVKKFKDIYKNNIFPNISEDEFELIELIKINIANDQNSSLLIFNDNIEKKDRNDIIKDIQYNNKNIDLIKERKMVIKQEEDDFDQEKIINLIVNKKNIIDDFINKKKKKPINKVNIFLSGDLIKMYLKIVKHNSISIQLVDSSYLYLDKIIISKVLKIGNYEFDNIKEKINFIFDLYRKFFQLDIKKIKFSYILDVYQDNKLSIINLPLLVKILNEKTGLEHMNKLINITKKNINYKYINNNEKLNSLLNYLKTYTNLFLDWKKRYDSFDENEGDNSLTNLLFLEKKQIENIINLNFI